MDVIIKNIKFVNAEDSGGIFFADNYGKVVRHDIEVTVEMKGVTIKGVFRFNADLFKETTSIGDYKDAIKNLFREQ